MNDNTDTVPMPKADPRGYDSSSSHRDFGKYPASIPEMGLKLLEILSGPAPVRRAHEGSQSTSPNKDYP